VLFVPCERLVVAELDDCFFTKAAIMLLSLAPPLAGKL
jgi:hypothetical protein